YARQLIPTTPRHGKNNDQAHSPIYPLKSGNGLTGEEKRVYEFVARHFLACISENAKGLETSYTLEVGGEINGGVGENDGSVYKAVKEDLNNLKNLNTDGSTERF